MREPAGRSALERWRELDAGFSPLFSEPLVAAALDHLEPAIGPGRGVLDLGAGAGHMAAVFQAQGGLAIALDVALAPLRDGAGRYPGPARLAADQGRLPLGDATLDAVFSFSSIQYSDRATVLAECRRVLRPGGRIAIVENLFGNPFVRLGRWLRAVSGTPYGAHLAPRRHLRWAERSIYERFFSHVRFQPFHVLTPVLLSAGSMDHEPVRRDRETGARALYAMLHRWDGPLVRRWPAGAWCVVVCGVR